VRGAAQAEQTGNLVLLGLGLLHTRADAGLTRPQAAAIDFDHRHRRGRRNLRRQLPAAVLLGLGVAAGWSEEVQGKIQSVDASERTIVLEDGSKIWIAEGVPMDNLKEGKAVKASYEERDGKKVATTVEVAE
jgi:hypothetical protein